MSLKQNLSTKDFFYELPSALIAQRPADRRDHSRLLVCRRDGGKIEHKLFRDLPEELRPGDCLVLNNSKVRPARLLGKRDGGGNCELLLLQDKGEDVWRCLARPGRRLMPGTELCFGEDGGLRGEILAVGADGGRDVRFCYDGDWQDCLARYGVMPLPPYITEKPADPERYQTVYAKQEGSAAAPTAGLHFTRELLERIRDQGVMVAELTLHVGLGTFRPVKTERIEDHVMHSEVYDISPEAARTVNGCKQSGGRVVAVGTTSCRTLEAAARGGILQAGCGETDIFIRPGYRFQITDALITNFHLPESTLLMLVSAFWERERVLAAYREAIAREYRFFSFGDAMLIVDA